MKHFNRAKLIEAVKTPLGWLTLALLVAEGILTVLATKAKGVDFTILLIGILVIFVLMVAVVAEVASTSHATPGKSKEPGRLLSNAVTIILILAFGGGSVWGGYLFLNAAKESETLHSTIAEIRAINFNLSNENNRISQECAKLDDFKNKYNLADKTISLLQLSNTMLTITENKMEDNGSALQKAVAEWKGKCFASEDECKNATAKLFAAITENRSLDGMLNKLTDENSALRTIIKGNDGETLKFKSTLAENTASLTTQLRSEQNVNQTLKCQLKPVEDMGITAFYKRAGDFTKLGDIRPFIKKSTNSIIFFGVDFFTTLSVYQDDLLEALQRGVKVQILMFDESSRPLGQLAEDFSQSTKSLLGEFVTSNLGAKALLENWADMASSSPVSKKGLLEIRLTQRIPRMRYYMFDSQTFQAVAFVVPYLNRTKTEELPGFLLINSGGGLLTRCYDSFQSSWDEATNFDAGGARLASTAAEAAAAGIKIDSLSPHESLATNSVASGRSLTNLSGK